MEPHRAQPRLDGLSKWRCAPGKLRGAAIVWARRVTGTEDRAAPEPVDETEAKEWEALGGKVKVTAPQGKRDFRVTPQNWQALTFFLDLQTQWRVVAGAKGLIWLGLDYTAVEALMRMKKVKGKTRMINKMQAMEEAALTVLSGAVLSDADLAWSSGERP